MQLIQNARILFSRFALLLYTIIYSTVASMKKNILFVLIITVATIVYLNFHKPSANSKEFQAQSTSSKNSSKSLTDQIKQFPGLDTPKLSPQESQSECKEALESIETLPLQTLIYDLGHNKFKLKSDCLFISKNSIALLDNFPEACEKIENNEPSKACIEKLFFYKALRIHHATINDDLDSLPTEIIINKLIGLIAENAFNTPDGLKLVRAVGAKIYERLPESESAAKAAVIGYFGDENLSDIDRTSYNKLLDEARSKFPENWEIYEMDLVRKKMNNDDSFKNEVVNYFQSHSDSAIANYQMGCFYWSDSKVDEAQNLFKKSVQLSPNDQRFVGTLQKSQTMTPPEKVCSVQINFDPDKF